MGANLQQFLMPEGVIAHNSMSKMQRISHEMNSFI